jgi:subtilisin family serine protease
MKRLLLNGLLVAVLVATTMSVAMAAPDKNIGINVVLNTEVNDAILAELGQHGRVLDILYQVNALTMRARESELGAIQALPFVAAANPDAERTGVPIYTVTADDFADGLSTWDLDAINVTDLGFDNRQVDYDGEGVYVAVIDTGLIKAWRQYFPEERIATEYAMAFGGGGGEMGSVSSQPNKWERDVNSHGTHVTSTILGYHLRGTPINGVAPLAKVIPIKVLNQAGFGWSSVVARGIEYVGELKAGPLADYPVVINMSLGGPVLDAVEKAAIDYAIAQGVIIVASAGNRGTAGMGYPGAYEPVISAAASGWIEEWTTGTWWYALDVVDPTDPDDFYITSFSSRELPGQDLDVAAPGSWVVGPYHIDQGNALSYFFLGGTSMSSPHVAGTVALMLQKDSGLTASEAEAILEGSAVTLGAGCRTVARPSGPAVEFCWDTDATGAGLLDAAAALDATP